MMMNMYLGFYARSKVATSISSIELWKGTFAKHIPQNVKSVILQDAIVHMGVTIVTFTCQHAMDVTPSAYMRKMTPIPFFVIVKQIFI